MNKPCAMTLVSLVVVLFALVEAAPSIAAAPPGRYTITDDTVYDTMTKLSWQRQVPSNKYDWSSAKAYCAALSLDGAGWRLPNMKELQTIVDETVKSPAIDKTTFPSTPSDQFWSSSPISTGAWSIFFFNGGTYANMASNLYRVRCVR